MRANPHSSRVLTGRRLADQGSTRYPRGFGPTEATVHWQRWVVVIAAVLLLWMVRSILPPFVVAAIVAYVLSPLVGLLMARGLRRPLAATVVFLAFLAPLVLVGF